MGQASVLVLLCLLAATAHGASLRFKSGVHSDLCEWGPQYWCSSEQTAARCGKTTYCQKNDWTQELIRDDRCKATQDLVKSTRTSLSNKPVKQMAEHDIAILLARACSTEKEHQSRMLCKDIVTDSNILPKLIKLVLSRLPTVSVATAVGACRRQEVEHTRVHCETECGNVIKTLQMSTGTVFTHDHYMRMFKPICARTLMAQHVCEAMAHANYEKFVQGITSAAPSEMCPKTSTCVKNPSASKGFMASFTECSMCKDVVSEIRAMSRSSEVQSAVRNLMKSACTHSGEFKDLCDTLADEGLIYVAELIASEMEPVVVCEKLLLCKEPETKVLASSSSSVNEQQQAIPNFEDSEDELCELCEYLVAYLDTQLKKNTTIDDIKKILNKTCDELPAALKPECHSLVKQYFPVILAFLEKGFSPKKACQAVKMCPATPASVHKTVRVKESTECDICKLVVSQLSHILSEKSTKEEIDAALDKVCEILPQETRDSCTSIINTYAPLILQLISEELEPTEACTLLNFCAKSAAMKKSSLSERKENADSCGLCEFVMQELDGILKENSTQQEIVTALDQVCQFLPGTLKADCDTLVKQYTPMLIEMLLQYSPSQVCTMIGLCSSTRTAPVMKTTSLSEHKVKADSCGLCEFVLQELDGILKENSTQQEIVTALDQVCQFLPGTLKADCDTLVKQYTPMLIEMLLQYSPSQVCTMIGLCSSTRTAPVMKTTSLSEHKVKADSCGLCEFVMQELDGILKENRTKQEIVTALDQVCQFLPGTLKADCDTLVKQYTPMLIEMLLQYSPSQVCTMIGLCSSTRTAPVMKTTSLSEHKVKADSCGLCEFVMQELDGILKENSTQQEIVTALDQVCQFLPGTLKADCDTLVKQYTPMLIEMLLQYSPSQVCTMIGLCSSTRTAPVMKTSSLSEHKVKADSCGLCEFVLQELDGILKENSTQQEIVTALDQVCQFLPGTLKADCDTLVKQYTPMLIEMLLQYSPSQVCTMIGLCSSTRTAMKLPSSGEHSTSPGTCVMCEFVMQKLDDVLSDNKTQQEIVAALDQVCQLAPASLKTECDALIKQYGPMLIQMLLEYSPAQVCFRMGLCSSPRTAIMLRSPSLRTRASSPGTCALCEFVMQQLDGILKENSTQQEIIAALDQVCQFLPATLKTECDTLVKQFTPTLIQILLAYKPSEVCTMIGLCNSTQRVEMAKKTFPTVKADLCPICELVIKELDGFLGNNKAEQSIEAALDQVCDLLPGDVKTECEALVQQYTPTIIQLVLAYPTRDVCKLLGLCPDAHTVSKMTFTAVRKLKADLCPICELVIEELDGFLGNNKTEQSIEAALDQVCDLLPGDVKTECEALVQQYTPTIIKLVLAYHPRDVCKLLGLCPDAHTVDMSKMTFPAVRKLKADLCPICELVIEELDGFLGNNKTEQSIEAALDQVCDLLPGDVKTECEALVQQYTPTIIKLVLAYHPRDVCKLLGLCPDAHTVDMSKMTFPAVRKLKADLCPICELVIEELDGFLGNNKTEQSIEAALDQVCDLLPGDVKTECEALVQQYTPTIIKLVLAYHPRDVCKLLGLCPDAHTVDMSKMTFPAVRKLKADLCPICELVIEELDGFLGNNKTEQSIEAALDQVCDLLPGDVKTECEALVQQYTPTIIKLVLAYHPRDVCKLLGLCPDAHTVDMSKMTFPAVRKLKADLCPICELVIEELDGFLGNNKTEQSIEAALDQVCDLLPGDVKTECEALVQQYTPTIIKLVLAYHPRDVCKLLGLCPDAHTVDMSKMTFPAVRKLKADLCPICELVIEELDGFLGNNKTEQSIEAALDQVCDLLPGDVKTECEALVQQYTPTIIKLVLAYHPRDVCKLLGLCPDAHTVDMSKMTFPAVRKLKADLCPICELVIEELDGFLGNNKTEQSIEAALDQVCDLLPGDVKTECEALVQQYTPTIIKLVLAYHPRDVCKLLGLCPDAHTVDMSKMTFPAVRKLKADLCPICELVIEELDGFLGNNKTEQSIEAALDQVCDLLPGDVKTECEALVQQYTPTIIKLVLAYHPRDVCKLLGLCPDAHTVDMSKMTFPAVRKLKADLCPICELVIEELDGFLGNNKTEQSIEAALDQVCDLLPGDVKTECEALVQQYTPTIIKLVLAYPPRDVCKLLGLCPDALKKIELPVVTEVKSNAGPLCAICEFAMTELDNILQENSTEQQIEAALDSICQILPATIKSECDSLVKQYTPFIVKLLVSNLQPKQVCTTLALCPMMKHHIDALEVSRIKKQVQTKQSGLCTLCSFVFTTVDQMLDSNSTKQEAIAVLDKVCEVLPAAIKDECEPFVALYAPYVLDLVVQKFSPTFICQYLGFCTNASLTVVEKSALQIKKNAVAESELCTLCQYVLQYLDNIVAENSTLKEIENALEYACQVVPASLKDQCDSLIELWTPQLIAYILHEVQPKEICVSIGFCNAHELKKSVEVKKVSADTCDICETVLTYIDQVLNDNATKEEIENTLTLVCDILPGSIKAKCEKYVTQYFNEIVDLLVDFPASELCKLFHLCPSSEEIGKTMPLEKVNLDVCHVCESVLTYIDQTLKDNATREEIENVISMVCEVLPTPFKAECDKYVKQYYSEIVNLLLDFPPSEVCKLLSLCPSPKGVRVPEALQCELCELVIERLESLISSTSTEDEIETALEKVCSLLPSSLKTDCDNLVETYTPTLIKLLLQETRPRQVCIELSVCTNDRAPKTVLKTSIFKVKDEECDLCLTLMTELETMLTDKSTEDEIRNVLDFVCTRVLPKSFSDECVSLVDSYVPLIIQYLSQSVSPKELCQLMGVCKASDAPKVALKTSIFKVKDEECDLCVTLMTELETMLTDKSTEDEIRNVLDFVCTRVLPKSFSDECVSLVDSYVPLIIQYLSQSVSPKELCQLMGVCKASTAPKAALKTSIFKVKDEECDLCVTLMTELETMLTDKSTEDEIRNVLDFVCTRVLPKSFSDECVSLVDSYVPLIIQYLSQSVSPKELCQLMGVCKASDVKPQEMSVKAGPVCPICEFVALNLDNLLEKNSTQEQIEQALEKVCNVIPATLKKECVSFVVLFSPQIVDFLVREMRPDVICKQLKLCTEVSAAVKEPQVTGLECDLCELVINQLKSKVSSKSSEAEIEAALKEVCNFLPEAIQSECNSMVDQYAPLIVQLILKDLTAQEICQKIGMCPSAAKYESTAQEMSLKSGPLCPICEFVALNLDNLLEKNSTQQEIEQALEQVCNFIPATLKKECVSLIVLFSPQIVDFLVKEMKPDVICKQLNLCVNASVAVKESKVGGVECELCELVINKLKSEVSSKASEAEIEAAIKEVCSLLPQSLSKECQSLVDQYAPLILQFILQDLSAQEICQKLEMCTSSIKQSKVGGVECELCELVINKLKSEVSSKASEAEIEAAIKEVCSLLPQSLSKECQSLVDQYAPLILQFILQDLSAQEICEKLGMCSSSIKPISTPVKQSEKSTTTSTSTCVTCEVVVQMLQSMVSSKSSETEIESALKRVCHVLPSIAQNECDSLVDIYGPRLIKFIVSELSPSEICKELDLCPTELKISMDVANMEACTLCKFALEELKGFIQDRPTVTALTEGLKYVCDRLPLEMRGACLDLAIMFGPDLVIYLDDKIAPRQMCQMIRLCPPPKPSNVEAVDVVLPPLEGRQPSKSLMFKPEKEVKTRGAPPPPVMPNCSACKFALYEVQTALETPFWQDEAPKILNLLCDRIEQWPDVCQFMVKQNLPKLINDARGFRFPIEFCQDLQLCEPPKPSVVVHLSPKKRCDLCNRLVQYMGYSKTQGPMDAESICGFLVPVEHKPLCLSLVQKYSSLLMGLLKKHQDPFVVCQTVNVCPKPSAPKPSVIKSNTPY